MKLIALYSHPENPGDFDTAYSDTHLPLIKKVPGLKVVKVVKHSRTFVGGEGALHDCGRVPGLR